MKTRTTIKRAWPPMQSERLRLGRLFFAISTSPAPTANANGFWQDVCWQEPGFCHS